MPAVKLLVGPSMRTKCTFFGLIKVATASAISLTVLPPGPPFMWASPALHDVTAARVLAVAAGRYQMLDIVKKHETRCTRETLLNKAALKI